MSESRSIPTKINWYVYIVECVDGTYYTGISINVEKRVHQHNHTKKAAAYTRSRRPVKLCYSDGPFSKRDALRIERQIKGLTRQKKEAMIRAVFPTGGAK